MVTVYNNKQYISHHFEAKELDKIKNFMYNNDIKWYTIAYNDKEKLEYEQFSKRHN